MSSGVYSKLAKYIPIALMRGVTFTYDTLTLPIYTVIQKPWKKRAIFSCIRAQQLSPSDPYSPWVRNDANCIKQTMRLEKKATTIDELFRQSVATNSTKNAFGFRRVLAEQVDPATNLRKFTLADQYEWITYKEADARVEKIAKGLLSIGVKSGDTVMIFAETRLEWQLTAQAIFRIGSTVATAFATLGDNGVIHCVNETGVEYLVTSADLMPKVQKLHDRMPKLRVIIYFEGLNPPSLVGFGDNIKQIMSYSQLIAGGEDKVYKPPTPTTMAVLLYTSGSTGTPKAIEITHKNLLGGVTAISGAILLKPTDIFVAYLPLAHAIELIAEVFVIAYGVRIGYSTPLTLTAKSPGMKPGSRGDMEVLKPTMMGSVPLVLDRLRKSVSVEVSSRGEVFESIFDFLMKYKRRWMQRGYTTPIVNKVLCAKLRKVLGSKIEAIVCGGAALSHDTHEFIREAFDVSVTQGYGLTEVTGAVICGDPRDSSAGHCGPPLPGVRLALQDWPEGGYHVTDKPNPRGEIIVFGDNVSHGYYKNSAMTEESFVTNAKGERWFFTGDIGEILPDGSFKIIDRKKDLIKLQNGKFVSLGKIEAQLKNSVFVDNILVYGDSYANSLVALISPNVLTLQQLATQMKKEKLSFVDQCKDEEIIREVTRSISEYGRSAGLQKIEIPTRITLCPQVWSPDNGLLTALLKVKRKELLAYYNDDINRMCTMLKENGVTQSVPETKIGATETLTTSSIH